MTDSKDLKITPKVEICSAGQTPINQVLGVMIYSQTPTIYVLVETTVPIRLGAELVLEEYTSTNTDESTIRRTAAESW